MFLGKYFPKLRGLVRALPIYGNSNSNDNSDVPGKIFSRISYLVSRGYGNGVLELLEILRNTQINAFGKVEYRCGLFGREISYALITKLIAEWFIQYK